MILQRGILLGLGVFLFASTSLADKASCEQCLGMVTTSGGQCEATENAGYNGPECAKFFDCIDACQDQACADQCEKSPDGVACIPLLDKADQCVCGACPAQCGDQDFCGGTGTGGSGGSGPADPCDTCADTAFQGACAATITACKGDAACGQLADCLYDCQDQACADKCVQANPQGEAKLNAIDECVCNQCSSQCTECGAGGSGGSAQGGSGGSSGSSATGGKTSSGGTTAEGGSSGSSATGGSGGKTSGTGGKTSSGGSSGKGGSKSGSGGTDDGAAGSEAAPGGGGGSSDSGCAVSAPGGSTLAAPLLGLAALLGARLRRRRAR